MDGQVCFFWKPTLFGILVFKLQITNCKTVIPLLFQDLHQHTARAHCDKRRLRKKDASPEVSCNNKKKIVEPLVTSAKKSLNVNCLLGTTCRTLWFGILGTARPRKWRILETTRYPEIFYPCHTFLLIRALAVPEHDLRERGPGVHPGHSAGWTSLWS